MNTHNQHNSLQINKNALVLIIGESMGKNCTKSIELAHKFATNKQFGEVLLINTVQWRIKFRRTVREALGDGYDIDKNSDGLHSYTRTLGDLVNHKDEIDLFFGDGAVKTVIINCWEMAAGSSRYRERLLYLIQKFLSEYEATVIVYAQRSSTLPKAGFAERGGFGKLAGFADTVVREYREEKTDADSDAVLTLDPYDSDEYDEDDDDEMEEEMNDEDLPKGSNYVPYKPFVGRSGKPEVYSISHGPIFGGDELLDTWRAMGIPNDVHRVYMDRNPHTPNETMVKVTEEYMAHYVRRIRSLEVQLEDYDFPLSVPFAKSPHVGTTLEEFLEKYRLPLPGEVHNDVVELQRFAEAV